jgi:hypothetical protein
MMRIAATRLPLSLLALLPGATPVGAHRAPAPPLTSGVPVRLTAQQLELDRNVATVVALEGDTLVVRSDSVHPYALTSLDRLEVSRGQRSHARAGAM